MLRDLKMQSFKNVGQKLTSQLLCAVLCVTMAVTLSCRNEVVETSPRIIPKWTRSLKSMFTHVFNGTLLSTLIEFIECSHWPFKYHVKWKVPKGVTETYN